MGYLNEMITSNHIEYLKSTLESKEGYSYPEIYEWSNEFIRVQHILLAYADSTRCIPNDLMAFMKRYPWKNRYSSIVQHGTFYENIVKLEAIRRLENNENSWRVALDLKNISYEMANFEVCYCWMTPGRWFSADWRKLEEDVHFVLPFPSDAEANAWYFVDKMYKKISREHLPICTVEEFMMMKI